MRQTKLLTRLRTLPKDYYGREYDVAIARKILEGRRECLKEVKAKAPHLLKRPIFAAWIAEEKELDEASHVAA